MNRYDLHTHTVYCDGKNTPEEMVKAALRAGLTVLGFSGHSYTDFDESYCMSREGVLSYRREIAALKERYGDKIRILCGVEQDYYSCESTAGYDYVIGSLHYFRFGEKLYPIDLSPEKFIEAVRICFAGDYYAAAEQYYDTLGDLIRKTNADIVGHFDLITKFNENGALFDETDPRYRAAWKRAADRLIAQNRFFEINTGAIARGYRTHAYPSAEILNYLKEKGANLILSGDSHSADTLCFAFEHYEKFVPADAPERFLSAIAKKA